MAHPIKAAVHSNGPVTVGRGQLCDVVVKHMSVSNRHCEIGVEGDEAAPRCYIKDLSTNGTWIRRMGGLERGGHSSPERVKKGATLSLAPGDVVLLLPPTHEGCEDTLLRLEYDAPLKQYAVRFDPRDLHTDSSKHNDRTKRPVAEGAGTRLSEEPARNPEVKGQPVRCASDGDEGIHLSVAIVKDAHLSNQNPTGQGINKALATPPTDAKASFSDLCPVTVQVCAKDGIPSRVEGTPVLATGGPLSSTGNPSPSPGGPLPSPGGPLPFPGGPLPSTGGPLPSTGGPLHSGSLPSSEDVGRCPLCGSIFPLSLLPAHCAGCPSAPPTPSPSRLVSLRPTVSLEQCPSCGELFTLSELIPHWEVCSKKGANRAALCKDDGGEDCLEQCLHCLNDYLLSDLLEHVKSCPMKDKKCLEEEHCQHCLKTFPLSELVEHTMGCEKRTRWKPSDGSQGSSSGEPLERCMHCFRDFPLSSLVNHTSLCVEELSGPKDRFKGFIPSVHDLDATAIAVLNDTQRRAVDYVIERSRADSDRVYTPLVERARRLGYEEKDVQRTLHWVRNEAPIIIHINLERVLGFLVKDTHYRNQFETRTSGGSTDLSARGSWEDNIFNKIYAASPPFDRVKYGVLNIVGDPCGVRSCYHYGDSFLQLKKVRLRTTFASTDSSHGSVKLSCCEHYGNVLYEYLDPELKAILDVATRRASFMKSDIIANYKEVQVHGPVCLSENVECIVVNHRHRGDATTETLLEEFVKRNSCNLIWMEPDDHTPSTSSVGPRYHDYSTSTHSRRRRRKRRRRDYYDDPPYS